MCRATQLVLFVMFLILLLSGDEDSCGILLGADDKWDTWVGVSDCRCKRLLGSRERLWAQGVGWRATGWGEGGERQPEGTQTCGPPTSFGSGLRTMVPSHRGVLKP